MNNVMCLVDIAADDPDINLTDHGMKEAEISVPNERGGVNATKTVESSSYARKIALALRRLATAFDAHNGTVTPGELSRVKWFFRMFHSRDCLSWKDLARLTESVESNQKFCEDIQSSFRGNDNLDTLVKFEQTLSLLLNETPKYMRNQVCFDKSGNGGKTPRRHGLLCRILMDVLKASEWTVDEMQKNNPFSLTEKDEGQSDSFENDCTNYILLFTPYPKSIATLKRLLNTPSATKKYGTTPCASPLPNISSQSNNHENGGMKSVIEGVVDSVYTLLNKSFQKMSIKLLWIDTSMNDLEKSCEMIQSSQFRCFDRVASNRHKFDDSDFCVQACKKLSMRLGIPGFSVSELFYKPQLASIGNALARHLLDQGVSGNGRCKKKLLRAQGLVHTRARFQGPLYLSFTGIASKAFKEENHSIGLEIFCVREDSDAKDTEERLSRYRDFTGCSLVVEHLLSYEFCAGIFTTKLCPYLCRPKVDDNSHDAIEKFQTLMMYLSTRQKCALISVYKTDATKITKTNRYRKRFPPGKLIQCLLLKPFTPTLGFVSEMSSLMDQIKNSVFDGSLSSGGQVLGKQAESNTPSMHNFHHPDADIDTHACPTSILLNLNQNYNLVRSRPHLESNIPSGSIPTLYIPDGNQTDSSQMTMIISSSEGDDDDTNALHVNDIQEETETDYDDRGNEGINVAAGAVQ
eukprot:g2701.t1